jgi:2-dehydropantoate 2-reductase
MENKRKYLIAGTGGVGGSIAAFLARSGQDVTCIARGAHLDALRQRGLHLISDLQGNHQIPIRACTAEEYADKADVIFVCVKSYSLDSILPLLQKAAHADTLIIPLLNGFGYGATLTQKTGLRHVADGCVYIVAFLSGAGEVTQTGQVFRIVFGPPAGSNLAAEQLLPVRDDLQHSGIRTILSEDIRCDTFIKWSFISAMACTGAAFNVPMGALQTPGPERDTFAGLSDESTRIGRKLGLDIPANQTEKNLAIIDALAPESTASMQKDIEKGRPSEINELLFDWIPLAESVGVEVPVYQHIALSFKNIQP